MIEETLKERGDNYGSFHTLANLSQTLSHIIKQHYRDTHVTEAGESVDMPNFAAEAVHMICQKLSRLANGNVLHTDSWHDIAGYATLVENIILESEARRQQALAEAQKVKAEADLAALEATETKEDSSDA